MAANAFNVRPAAWCRAIAAPSRRHRASSHPRGVGAPARSALSTAANFDRYDVTAPSDDIARKLEAATARSRERWAANGLVLTHAQTGLVSFLDEDGWYSANRKTLMDG